MNLKAKIEESLSLIRYEELKEVIGKNITVSSTKMCKDEIFQSLQNELDWLPLDNSMISPVLSLLKYEIADVSLAITADTYCGRITAESLAQQACLPVEDLLTDVDEYYLDTITKESRIGKLYALFLLRSRGCFTSENISYVDSVEFRNSFPRDLTVEDACITNAESLWLVKYLYL